MAYHEPTYFMMFLPAVLLCYEVAPKRMRWGILLAFSYIFYFLFSKKLIVYLLAATVVAYGIGMLLASMKKKCKVLCKVEGLSKEEKKQIKKQRKTLEKSVLICGIFLLLGMLLYLKYSGFFAENLNAVFAHMKIGWQLPIKELMLSLGISFYTMSAISYIVDVYWEKIKPERNIGKFALFMGFFPTIVEGPICMYSDTADTLTKGEPLKSKNLVQGAVRIAWGLFKKVVIADRLYVIVTQMFDNYASYQGVLIVVAAVAYTTQLYMEFSGCMDIVIGSGEMFGIRLPENFAQPFASKNASEFWRRWHISLGRWFKTYIFYPVSMSGLAKSWNKFAKNHTSEYVKQMVMSALALFPVWFCNGLWHGANWSYLFYGMYYFVIILSEQMLEPPMARLREKVQIKDTSFLWNGLRIAKTWVIIFTGELFFRADTLKIGIEMFRSMFHDFHIERLWDGTLLTLGLGKADMLAVVAGCIVVAIVGHLHEKKIQIREKIAGYKLPLRWVVYIGLFIIIVVFGAYGPGYQEVDFIYAGF